MFPADAPASSDRWARMRLERVDASDARAVLRGLRGAVLGAGPAMSNSRATSVPGARVADVPKA